MAKQEKSWVRVKALTREEKVAIAAACERLITGTLKPRFLPEIHPTEFNYIIDILGKWRGNKYGFIARYRSGFPNNAGEEFESAFARIDHVEESIVENRFDVMWHRHTGQWWRLHPSVTLEEALRLIETEPLLRPPL
jgi:hypothetical protein